MRSALCGIYPSGKKYGVSFLDLSTGEFFASIMDYGSLTSFLGKFQPKEILIPEDENFQHLSENFRNIYFTPLKEDFFSQGCTE
ncbi:MAG: hypothetical protein Q9M89_03755 [Persephonella sp.]|nr:hypothetical protein [Persephonella sp.]